MADATVTHGGTDGFFQLRCDVFTHDDSYEHHRSIAQFIIHRFDVCSILNQSNLLFKNKSFNQLNGINETEKQIRDD